MRLKGHISCCFFFVVTDSICRQAFILLYNEVPVYDFLCVCQSGVVPPPPITESEVAIIDETSNHKVLFSNLRNFWGKDKTFS